MSPTSTHRTRPPWRGHTIVMAIMVATALMLSAAVSFAQGITTDKLSYVPGERVMITGQGWQPNEVVTLSIGNAAGTRAPYDIDVITGSDGGFTDSSFVVQEIDRGQMLTVAAEGLTSGVQTMMAIRDGAAPGALRCSTLSRYDSTHYGLVTGQQVACTIEGATDLSAAQQAGTEPVEVLVRTTRFGNMPATVTSVRGTTISFVYTAPANGCDPATVSYGPIRVCDSSYGQCTMFPAQGNDVNSYYLSGTRLAAGFIFTNGWRDICCAAPKLKIDKYPQFGTFMQGGQATYTLVVSNPVAVGGTWANNVKVTDQLPGNGGLVWQFASASQGSCSIVNNLLNCSLGTIQPQRSATITVSTTATTPPAACQAQPNPRAIATADGGFIAYASGFLTCTPPPTQLKVVKTPDNGPFTMGSQVSFTIVVSNPGAAGSASARNVQLNDALPGNGGLLWASATSTAGSCSVVNNNLSCSLGDIPAGGSVTVRVFSTQTTPDAACQYQPNAAAIATADGGISAEDQGSLICTPSQPPQLRVVKTPDNFTFTQGSQIAYTIVVSNPAAAGSAAATNVQLSDQLPGNGGLVWASATPTQGACSLSSNSLSCALGTIQAGGSVTVTVLSTPTTPTDACQPQPNPVALATADGGLSAQDSGYQSCTPSGVPQLRVVKTPDNGTFPQGGQVRYTIVVRNPAAAGSAAATNVRLTDVLPVNGGLTWTSYTATQGSCTITGNTLSCSLGNIAAGGSVTVVVSSPLTTPAAACQPQPNPVAIATADGGLTAQDSGYQTCAPPQLRVVKTPDNGTFTEGGPVSYTIVVSNPAAAGGTRATDVRLTDVLPVNGGLTWTSYTATQGSCTITGNTLSCSLGNIAAGAAVTVVVSSPATTPSAACQSQPNPAAIATASGGLTAQDSGSQSCTPPAPPQIAVVKTPDNGTFTQGGQVRYTIVVSNPAAAGGSPATNVRLSDVLPTNGGLSWATYTSTQGGCSIIGNTLSCFLGTIPAGGSATVVVSSPVTTPDAACQSQPNPAAIATADGSLTAQDSGSLSCTPPVAAIGDRVWRDLNGNGIQDCQDMNNNGIIGDAGDVGTECSAGVPGVTVNLVNCLTPSSVLATTQTDANGFYLFQNLSPGQYCVRFNLGTVPAGICAAGLPQFTTQDAGANDALDSDANPVTGIAPAVTLVAGQTNRTVDAGIVCRECAVAVDKKCQIQTPPSTTFTCSSAKPIDSLTMIWTGQSGIYIKAWKGTPGSTLLSVQGPIATGQTVTVTGMGGSPLDQVWEIFSGPPTTSNKIGQSQFHISCSDVDMNGPEDCGKLEGNAKTTSTTLINLWRFEGMAGNGQSLVCSPSSPAGLDTCSIVAGANPSCQTVGKPKTLVFRYTGNDCSASRNNQAADKWFCSGVPGSNPFISIVKDPSRITVTPTSGFAVGDLITVSAIGTDMGAEIQLQVGGQTLKIHTSCSQPLAVGDVFGSFELVQFNGQGAGANVTYSYEVRNNGGETLDITSVADDKLGELLTQTRTLAAGGVFTLQKTAFITQTTTNVVTTTARLAGTSTVCGQATDQVTVTVTPQFGLAELLFGTEPKR